MNLDEKSRLIFLHQANISDEKIKLYLDRYGSAGEVFANESLSIPENIEKILEFIDRFKIEVISFLDKRYPKSFLKLPEIPPILYVRGDLDLLHSSSISIVGTRKCTLYGRSLAEEFSSFLASQNYTITSGLAHGIDSYCHQGALSKGKTIAILGSGLLNIYPKENHFLAEKIVEEGGAIISQFAPFSEPLRYHFPQRNHLVAMISEAILLIESPIKGGAMLTMQNGYEYNKKLFTLPGRIDMETFAGNHFLIKEQKARLVESPEEILKFFEKKVFFLEKKEGISLSEEEKKILNHLSFKEKSLEELVLLTQYPIMKLNILLTNMVLKKILKEFPGKIYKKIDSWAKH